MDKEAIKKLEQQRDKATNPKVKAEIEKRLKNLTKEIKK